MTEQEKIINRLKEEIALSETANQCKVTLGYGIVEDIIALLKTLEPLPVIRTTSTIRCPRCNKQITSRGCIHNNIKYCWKCGQAVKWE